MVAVGGGAYLLARDDDDGGPDRSPATTSVGRTTTKGGGSTPAARRTAVARDVARLMTLSAKGRALTAVDPQAALVNRRRVLRRLDALRPADDGQRTAIDAFRDAIRASISANQARLAGRPATADADATAAKRRFCDLWSSSGMAADAQRSCDPGRI
ncbi:hypothetical protein PAI11_17830 [Patulibacter medicamentivorans]|uniref:Uncharacterized protein n=1 Tax=Patulibacter medicamentivorans TaxID=1097667 RepID=H0E4Q2_9ACTN|nr:hypothetical protein PAI11_17830 [Patulibacter medicamentivorans]